MKKIGIFWLREDFRVLRNDALLAATNNHDNTVVIYIYKKKKFLNKEAQSWWIYQSIKNFRDDLRKFNINLQVLSAENYIDIFKTLFKKKDFKIYWNKIYEPDYLRFDEVIKKKLMDNQIEFKIFKGNVLNEFNEVKKGDNTPFKVFTPFWRAAENVFLDKIPPKLRQIKKSKKLMNYFKSEVELKKIFPQKKWHSKFEKIWKPNEKTGLKKLDEFLSQRANDYANNRNIPHITGTSRLSPFIKNGQLHVETIWLESKKYKIDKNNLKKYLAEIGWREFSHSLINYFPYMLKSNYSKKFDKFPWQKNDKLLNSWKEGKTGYPIVDAGMREIYETGWMHNRGRMIVGSFLVKHLLIDWREGENYFRNCLVDFSEANNVSGWQWVAGSGADAAPYFRIFNPILQGEKFDKNGDYVKKWIPELSKIPNKFIHKPWEIDEKISKELNFIIGKDYPLPVVDHNFARERALKAFKKISK